MSLAAAPLVIRNGVVTLALRAGLFSHIQFPENLSGKSTFVSLYLRDRQGSQTFNETVKRVSELWDRISDCYPWRPSAYLRLVDAPGLRIDAPSLEGILLVEIAVKVLQGQEEGEVKHLSPEEVTKILAFVKEQLNPPKKE